MTTGLEFWHHHSAVSVPDLGAAIAWYREILGFEVEARMAIPAIPAEVAVLRLGSLRMELFCPAAGHPMSDDRRHPDADVLTYGNKHAAFGVSDVAATARELARRGAEMVWVKHFEFGSNAFIRDVAGNLIEFVQEAAQGVDLGQAHPAPETPMVPHA